MTKSPIICLMVSLLLGWNPRDVHGQEFQLTWLDIGEMHGRYSEIGALNEWLTANRGLEWPGILRSSGHYRAKAFWIGLKNWTDGSGQEWPYRVARNGLRHSGEDFFTPVESKLVAKFEDTEVVVDGYFSTKEIALVDEIDPDLPADRMVYQSYRSILGIETERWVYAYAHEMHDDYHIIRRRVINNGNTDIDSEIELQGQTLNDVMVFNIYRWVGREQAAWAGSAAQTWGAYNMIDIVGDGHEDYPVDFTAVYLWAGFDPDFSYQYWNNLGSPMIRPNSWTVTGDSTGRLAGMSMQGRIVLHADESPTDRSYNPANQPITLGWVENDERVASDWGSPTEEEYYETGILTRDNPALLSGGFTRNYPHYADRIEPTGEFWNPTHTASQDPIRQDGHAGGHSPSIGYGPYQMAFQDTINIVEAEGATGLSYKAATDIGIAYKASGFDDDFRIAFDANGDGIISDIPWDYGVYKNGGELLTKNQWVMTERDSLFQMMYRARDVWQASNGMSQYPIIEPPRPPRRFEVTGKPEKVELQWESMADSPDPEAWEVYRTNNYFDNLPYQLIATLPGSARSFDDTEVFRETDYYYFIQAVGTENPVDERGITGTPGGLPLKSGRYYTQTFDPTSLLRLPGDHVTDFSIVPNPINMASDESVRLYVNSNVTQSQVDFYDIPGHCTITIYTETGELVKRIEHTNGSGHTTWNLTTSSRQLIVSGIYLVRIVDNDTGETAAKKLVVIK